MEKKIAIHGTVVARKCGTCGHREIGIEDKNGAYVPLKPGMWIKGDVFPARKRTRKQIKQDLINYAESLDW